MRFPLWRKSKGNVDYCLDKEIISRYHAKITRRMIYAILQINSTNGTCLNENPRLVIRDMNKDGDQ